MSKGGHRRSGRGTIRPPRSAAPAPPSIVYLLFFLSGAACLVYELIWSRLLKDVFGVSAYATAAVLATYLAGLAAGSWVLGRAADRRDRALAFYGWLEIGIAGAALLGTLVIPRLGAVHAWAAVRLPPSSLALVGVRLLLGAIAILPSTFLMGGTVPAMTRLFAPRIGRLGRDLGLLYGLNTFGAVCGTLAAGFVLIGTIGVHPTLFVAAAVNLGVGGLALALARRQVHEPATAPSPAPAEPEPRSWLLLAVLLSGVAALALEVIWTRVLVLVVGSSTYAFATMLAAFLVGLALGSALARPFADRVADLRAVFGWVQAGIAASTLATIPLLWTLVASAQKWLLGLELDLGALTVARFAVAFLILLVPTTLIGMSFPLAAKLGARRAGTVARDVGRVYAATSVGNIAGAIVGGFALLPLAGMQRSIALVSLLNLGAAAWGLRPRWFRLAPVLALSGLAAALFGSWQPRPFTTMEDNEADPVLYYAEGVVSTVKVTRPADDPRRMAMFVDGVRIGESGGGVDRKQQVLAHFPFLLHRRPEKLLAIGLGTGIVLGEAAQHPGVQSIDCVELSPTVIAGARAFADLNHHVLDDPRVHIIADDGVNFLERAPTRYDVIISDGKSRQGHSENSVFYADDYYRAAFQHLAPDGLFIQWTPLDEIPEDLRTIVRTFVAGFPHTTLFVAQNSVYLVGGAGPLALDAARIQAVLDAPATAGLRRYGWAHAGDLLAVRVADQDGVRGWLAGATTTNSFERPVLEFYSPRALATPTPARVAENFEALAAVAPQAGVVREVLAGLATIARGSVPAGVQRLDRIVTDFPERAMVRRWIADTFLDLGAPLEHQGDDDQAVYIYRRALAADPDSLRAHLSLGRTLMLQGATVEAARLFMDALRLDPDSSTAHHLLGKLLFAAGNGAGADEHLRAALRLAPERADVRYDLALHLIAADRPDDAVAELRAAIARAPRWPAALAQIAILLSGRSADERQEALRLAQRATELAGPRDAGVLELVAAAYAGAGSWDQAIATQQVVADLTSSSGDPAWAARAHAALASYRERRTFRP